MYKFLAAIFVLTVVIYMIAGANSSPMKKTAKCIYSMHDACQESNLYVVNHEPEENQKYLSSLSKKVNADLVSLKKRLNKLPEGDSIKAALRDFTDKWNPEKVEKSLLSDDGDFQTDLSYMTSLVPDTRRKWKTLFPIFRS